MGISMGGNSALTYAAYHRRRISHAFSMSGYLNLSAPTMRENIRVALIRAGTRRAGPATTPTTYWGPAVERALDEERPVQPDPQMRGMKVRVAAATGAPGRHDGISEDTAKGMPLETAAAAQTKAFETRPGGDGLDLSTDYQLQGTTRGAIGGTRCGGPSERAGSATADSRRQALTVSSPRVDRCWIDETPNLSVVEFAGSTPSRSNRRRPHEVYSIRKAAG